MKFITFLALSFLISSNAFALNCRGRSHIVKMDKETMEITLYTKKAGIFTRAYLEVMEQAISTPASTLEIKGAKTDLYDAGNLKLMVVSTHMTAPVAFVEFHDDQHGLLEETLQCH